MAIQRFAGEIAQLLSGQEASSGAFGQQFLAPSQDALLIAQQQEQQRNQFPGMRVGAGTR